MLKILSKTLIVFGLGLSACKNEVIENSYPVETRLSEFQQNDDPILTIHRRIVLQKELEKQKTLWSSSNPGNYRYILEADCFCWNGPNEIYVENNKIERIIYLGQDFYGIKNGDELSLDHALTSTVEELFDNIQGALEGKNLVLEQAQRKHAVEKFSVIYDEQYGFPIRISYDWVGPVDDEYIITLREFEAL